MSQCEKRQAQGAECNYGAILGLVEHLKRLNQFEDAIAQLEHIMSINETDGTVCNSCIERTILLNPSVKEMIIEIGSIVISSVDLGILKHPGASAIANLNMKMKMDFNTFKAWWKGEKQKRGDNSIKTLIKDIRQGNVTVQGYKIHFSTGQQAQLRANKEGEDTIILKCFGEPETQEEFAQSFHQELDEEKKETAVGGKLKSRRNRKNKKSGKSKSTKNRRKSKRRH